jgi:hypothetical protein
LEWDIYTPEWCKRWSKQAPTDENIFLTYAAWKLYERCETKIRKMENNLLSAHNLLMKSLL